MSQTFKYAVFVVLAAIIAVGGHFSWQFIFEKEEPIVPPKHYKIGILKNDAVAHEKNLAGFKSRFIELGYVDGQNMRYIERDAKDNNKDPALLKEYARELNELGLDIIVTTNSSVTAAIAKLPDLKTKVFFLAVSLPDQIVKNLKIPEGLVTGMGEGTTVEFSGKRVEFLKEINPSIKTVVSIIEKGHINAPRFKERTKSAAQALGIEMKFIEIDRQEDLPAKLPLLAKNFADAYIACPCTSNIKYAKQLVAQLRKEKMLSMSANLESGANIGYLAVYSDDRVKSGERAAEMVDQILKGKPISQISVEFAKDVLLELNLKTAKDIEVTISGNVLNRANKIYQE